MQGLPLELCTSKKGHYNYRFDQILKLRKLAETLKRIWHGIS